jgi:hypothetical protein
MYTSRPRRIEHLLPFATAWGDRACIIQGERAVGFSGLLRASAAKAAQLVEHGVSQGDRVLLLGWNGPEWVVNFWACLRIGAVPALANAWWSAGEIADAVERLQPKVMLADAPGQAKLPPSSLRAPWGAPVGEDVDPNVTFETSSTRMRPLRSSLRPAHGRPRRSCSHRSRLPSKMLLVTRRLPFTSADSASHLHTGPLSIGRIALVRASCSNVLFPDWPLRSGRAIDLSRLIASPLNAVPTMATRLIDHPDMPNGTSAVSRP